MFYEVQKKRKGTDPAEKSKYHGFYENSGGVFDVTTVVKMMCQ